MQNIITCNHYYIKNAQTLIEVVICSLNGDKIM
jgi:hypothetical protein